MRNLVTSKLFSITIVICTYNRASILSDCLISLFENLPPDQSRVEIIIINNNSTDNTCEVVNSFAKKYGQISLVKEDKIGLSHARNRGFRTANNPWIVYLDDDAKIRKKFFNEIFKTIQNYEFDCFGGRYEPWYKYGKPKWLPPSFGRSQIYHQETSLLREHYISGGIMAIKKEVLEKTGGFPTNLGMKGKMVGYAEETYLHLKLNKLGYKVGYNPSLVIDHLVGKHKLTLSWHIKASYAHGRDGYLIYKKTTNQYQIGKIIYDLLIGTPIVFVKSVIKLFIRKNFYRQNILLENFKHLANRIGRIHGIWKFRNYSHLP